MTYADDHPECDPCAIEPLDTARTWQQILADDAAMIAYYRLRERFDGKPTPWYEQLKLFQETP